MHTVAILALDHVVPADLGTAIETFGQVRLADGSRPYEVRVCAPTQHVITDTFTLIAPHGLEVFDQADTIIVPGCSEIAGPLHEQVRAALREAAAREVRVASICTGAFTLAAAGLLDGLAATTHWAAADRLAEMFPAIEVKPDVLYVDNGQFLTSAGASAGLDLCLHMVRGDFGSAVAADIARLAVVPLEREAAQAQVVVHPHPPSPLGSTLEPVLRWIVDNLTRDLTLAQLARRSGLSERTFNRRFRQQTGTTPRQWLLHARVRRAQYLLETTDDSVEHIADRAGFGSTTALRERFKRVVGATPHAYRRNFRNASAEQPDSRNGPIESRPARTTLSA
ncbi:GlxA family transcriptional regulator [Nocardia iowensis]|uniref:Helix-turn-helix domain-containing protein n=1 Tax=Nocardia iowensis TaxID=204891 RepID=A0ABX8RH77_NOCIO|nr:helix-turn-helix domain-containing protein [Nocardia iowensis]QXN88691.1 helix-turn-helix domain-containing protein [Nocardia iowensis]